MTNIHTLHKNVIRETAEMINEGFMDDEEVYVELLSLIEDVLNCTELQKIVSKELDKYGEVT